MPLLISSCVSSLYPAPFTDTGFALICDQKQNHFLSKSAALLNKINHKQQKTHNSVRDEDEILYPHGKKRITAGVVVALSDEELSRAPLREFTSFLFSKIGANSARRDAPAQPAWTASPWTEREDRTGCIATIRCCLNIAQCDFASVFRILQLVTLKYKLTSRCEVGCHNWHFNEIILRQLIIL